MVEFLEAKFVIDDHCSGFRRLWNEIVSVGVDAFLETLRPEDLF